MSDSMVKRWVRSFNKGLEYVHDEKRSGRLSLIDYDLLIEVEENIKKNQRFTIITLSLHFLQICTSRRKGQLYSTRVYKIQRPTMISDSKIVEAILKNNLSIILHYSIKISNNCFLLFNCYTFLCTALVNSHLDSYRPSSSKNVLFIPIDYVT